MNDLFAPPTKPPSNIPELTVSELAHSLKRTLEETYGRVRVRGELSRVKIHSSGHLYSDLKDADSVLNIICWRGTVSRLTLKPEEGLDVICTGKITSYPARSNYQMVVEHMELAGEGALLKMLEDRKKRLQAEGLFDPNRKKNLPLIPNLIGVITSPTGAVIQDILHRLQDRFPRPVLLWPVRVQGDGAAEEITAAINGFNSLDKNSKDGTIKRPDIIIVARGGGSLEDLMPFNEENVVRAAANSKIPLIAAIGHETDTTLIDFAADLRAPTPTAAAELAVPERTKILTSLSEQGTQLFSLIGQKITLGKNTLTHLSARLGDPYRLLETKTQKIDHSADRLTHSLERTLGIASQKLLKSTARLGRPDHKIDMAKKTVIHATANLKRLGIQLFDPPAQKLERAGKLLEILSFKSVLNRGFAVIRDENNALITSTKTLQKPTPITIEFSDGKTKAKTTSSS